MLITVSLWWIAIGIVLLLGVVAWVNAGQWRMPASTDKSLLAMADGITGVVRVFVVMATLIGLLVIFAIKGCVGW